MSGKAIIRPLSVCCCFFSDALSVPSGVYSNIKREFTFHIRVLRSSTVQGACPEQPPASYNLLCVLCVLFLSCCCCCCCCQVFYSKASEVARQSTSGFQTPQARCISVSPHIPLFQNFLE